MTRPGNVTAASHNTGNGLGRFNFEDVNIRIRIRTDDLDPGGLGGADEADDTDYYPDGSDECDTDQAHSKRPSRANSLEKGHASETLCDEILELVVNFLTETASNQSVSKYDGVLADCFSRLWCDTSQSAKKERQRVLDRVGTNSVILRNFKKILSKASPNLSKAVTGLLVSQGSFRLSKEDLQLCVDILKDADQEGVENKSVLKSVLSSLNKIVDTNCDRLKPTVYASFPARGEPLLGSGSNRQKWGALGYTLPFTTGDPLFSMTCKTEASVSLWLQLLPNGETSTSQQVWKLTQSLLLVQFCKKTQ